LGHNPESQEDLGYVPRRSFGQVLKEKRLAAGTTLEKLASRLKVTKGYLSRLESDKAAPSVSMIQKVAAVLGLDAATLSVRAGQLPSEVQKMLREHPDEALGLLREAFASGDGAFVARDAAGGLGTRSELASGLGHNPNRGREVQPPFSSAESEWQSPAIGLCPAPVMSRAETVLGDCFDWLARREADSIHAVVTDPPYGLREYSEPEKAKLRAGKGGVWRLPPSFDGCTRSPLPRFTVLTQEDHAALRDFFARWATLVYRVLVPGGHVFVATNPLVSHLVYGPMMEAGLEKRGEIIRLVQTLRGGDRPKNAHREFSEVTVMPRSAWEPWGLFRKPCEGRVQDNLRKWMTGGLRRVSSEQPFADVIKSAPTRNGERLVAPHPSLKPQAFMRQIVRSALPLGKGVVLDPFMGAGSTIAAACAVGYQSIGIEIDPVFFRMAQEAIPKLAALRVNGEAGPLRLNGAQSALFV
jgi:site-specific DNA-methyltransferase (adenine-specific)